MACIRYTPTCAPRGLGLDLAAGKVYWLQAGFGAGCFPPKIRRADIDGKGEIETLFEAWDELFLRGLALDLTADEECTGNINGDGQTDAADLALLLGAWGPNPGNPADLNNDGDVNAADLSLLLGAWGLCE